MHGTDGSQRAEVALAPLRSSQSRVSVALLAAVACVPIVIATGFLTDRSPEGASVAVVPGDISVLALRGMFDAAGDRRPGLPIRSGF